MNFKQLSIAALLAVSGIAANATVTAGAGGITTGSFLTLSSADVSGGAIHTQSETAAYYGVSPNLVNVAAEPTATVGNWIAVGPQNGTGAAATVTLAGPASYVSFDWGSVNSYNTLTVYEGSTSTSFSAAQAGLLLNNSDQYVHFSSTVGITSLVLSSTNNAFEASNFAVTAVPEPTNVAFLLAGLGMFGVMARRRRG